MLKHVALALFTVSALTSVAAFADPAVRAKPPVAAARVAKLEAAQPPRDETPERDPVAAPRRVVAHGRSVGFGVEIPERVIASGTAWRSAGFGVSIKQAAIAGDRGFGVSGAWVPAPAEFGFGVVVGE